MTDAHDSTNANRRSMREISHANPYTGETMGRLFNRGPVVAADGGRAEATDQAGADDDRKRELREVGHTSPNGSETVNRTFERGGESRRAGEK